MGNFILGLIIGAVLMWCMIEHPTESKMAVQTGVAGVQMAAHAAEQGLDDEAKKREEKPATKNAKMKGNGQ